MRTVTLIVVLVALASEFAGAQQPKAAFEVASVKRSESGVQGSRGGATPTGFSATNITLRQLIGIAYGLETPDVMSPERSRLLGGPGWAQTQRFDVTARAATEASRAQVNAMLRTLLEDRFKLVVTTEQRQRDAYVLRLARADGRLGPDLRKTADDCNGTPLNDRAAELNKLPDATLRTAGATCATPDSLAFQIDLTLNAAVVNETGLTGRWNYVISSNGLESGMRRTSDGTMREYPSIFKAVEEQLGLKLERRPEPAPFDVLVIKSVELPSEN